MWLAFNNLGILLFLDSQAGYHTSRLKKKFRFYYYSNSIYRERLHSKQTTQSKILNKKFLLSKALTSKKMHQLKPKTHRL